MKKRIYLVILIFISIYSASAIGSRESRESTEHEFTGKSLSTILDSRSDTRIMAKALHSTGLDIQIEDLQGYTLFVPSDSAVKKLTRRLQVAMLTEADVLMEIIKDIMVKGVYSARELETEGRVVTMGRVPLAIEKKGRTLHVADSEVVETDLYGRGFVVHVVSGVTLIDIEL